MFLSYEDRMLASKKLFGRDGLEGATGLTNLLCDLGHGVSVASDFDYDKGFSVIAVPEMLYSFGDAAKKLLDYAFHGGSLLISGARSIGEFIKAGLPVSITGMYENLRNYTLDHETYTSVYGSCSLNAPDAETIATLCEDARFEHEPFACLLKYGQGKIALIGSAASITIGSFGMKGFTVL